MVSRYPLVEKWQAEKPQFCRLLRSNAESSCQTPASEDRSRGTQKVRNIMRVCCYQATDCEVAAF
jgi:hypothetical protein